MAIVNYQRIADRNIQKLLEDPEISDKNKTDFQEYLDGLDVSAARMGIVANHLAILFKAMPDVWGSMNDRKLVNKTFKQLGESLSSGYLLTVKKVGKGFCRWKNDKQTPKGWLDIQTGSKKTQRRNLSPADMLTWEDGQELIKATDSIQLKAIIQTQLDAGMRPSEFIELNVGDVTFDRVMTTIYVKGGKTGQRQVICLKCTPALQQWLKVHPLKGNKKTPLWVSGTRHRRYNYAALKKRVRELGDKAGIDKPLDFYALRHSAVFLSKMDNLNPELAAAKFGHTVDYYISVYGRLSADDIKKRYSRHYKLTKDQPEISDVPLPCSRCGTVNEPGLDTCIQCSSPLTMEAALKKSNELDAIKEQMAKLVSQMTDLQTIRAELSRRNIDEGTSSLGQ